MHPGLLLHCIYHLGDCGTCDVNRAANLMYADEYRYYYRRRGGEFGYFTFDNCAGYGSPRACGRRLNRLWPACFAKGREHFAAQVFTMAGIRLGINIEPVNQLFEIGFVL